MSNKDNTAYNGNMTLKKHDVELDFTKEDIENYMRCSKDILFFAENYIKIVHPDRGLIPIELFDVQKKLLTHLDENRHSRLLAARQIGKCLLKDITITVRHKTISNENAYSDQIKLPIGDFFNLCKHSRNNNIHESF